MSKNGKRQLAMRQIQTVLTTQGVYRFDFIEEFK
jgi:hypothetical protein